MVGIPPAHREDENVTVNAINLISERGNYYGQANGHAIMITCERHGYRTRVWAAGAYLGSFVGKGRDVTAGFGSFAEQYSATGLTRKGAVEYLLDEAISRGHIRATTTPTSGGGLYKHFSVVVPA